MVRSAGFALESFIPGLPANIAFRSYLHNKGSQFLFIPPANPLADDQLKEMLCNRFGDSFQDAEQLDKRMMQIFKLRTVMISMASLVTFINMTN